MDYVIEKSNYFIGNRTRDLPAYSIVFSQLRYRVPPTALTELNSANNA
jgi:hypothetical protein